MSKYVPWLVCLFLANFAFGAQIVNIGKNEEFVIVSNDGSPFIVDDSVCLVSKEAPGKTPNQGTDLMCGIIAQKNATRIGIKATRVQGPLKVGRTVEIRRDARALASNSDGSYTAQSTETMQAGNTQIVDIYAGLNAGFDYYFPTVAVQLAVTRSFSLGIDGAYFKSNDSISTIEGLGGFLTANYYYTHYPFRGFYAQGGVGMYRLDTILTADQERTSPIALKAVLGWRGRAYWGVPIDIGVGAGVQYIMSTNRRISIAFDKLLPLFTAYLGYSF